MLRRRRTRLRHSACPLDADSIALIEALKSDCSAANMIWTAREIKLLGTKPDAEIARVLDRSLESVRLKRQKLCIESHIQPPWTDAEIQLLGTGPDREVARRIGRTTSAVQTKRLTLGIRSWRSKNVRVREPVEAEKTKLLFGPYHPPRTRRGKFLFCEWRGTVKVGDYSDGPIPWPVKWRTRSLILCGDLVRAVKQESEIAVAYQWGVCVAVVTKWRNALEVEPITEGTRLLKSHVQTEAMTPALRQHLSRLKTGKPRKLTRRGEASLMAALHRPKSARWFESMAPHFAARRGKPVDPNDRVWTPKEEELIGTMPDRAVAKKLRRSVSAVIARRQQKEIPYLNPASRPWNEAEIELLGKASDETVAKRTGRTLKSVQDKRRKVGLLVRPRARPWTATEDRLLGTKPDTKLAVQLDRSRMDVYWRRIKLGIKPAVERPPHRNWMPEEDKLLGTASDAAIGRKLGRSADSVQLRRLGLGWPSYRERMKNG
jgi:hypothetical protein